MNLVGTKIASKYIVGPKIGSGSFGQVYVVNLIGTNEIYALKKEDQKTKNSQLIYETRILKQLENCLGFSRVHWQGTQNRSNMMIMDLMGPSLQDLYELCGKKFSLKTTLMLADQMIQRIQMLHGKNFVHRDIKPQNFLMGISKESHLVYLIDFGLSKKFRDFKTHQHIPYKENKNLTGTARYASINAHLGIQQSRRDDLQAIGYVLLYFCQGYLPWQGIKANNKNEKYQKIMEKKMSIPVEIQCKGLPLQFSTYLNYCRSLKFDDKPDYYFLRKMFRQLLDRQGQQFDYQYDWTLITSGKTLDNGKIKIDLRVNQTDIDEGLKKKETNKKVEFENKSQNESGSIQSLEEQKIDEDKVSEEQIDLLEGEENIDDNQVLEGDNQKNLMEMHEMQEIDMEEKKYNLVYQDADNPPQ